MNQDHRTAAFDPFAGLARRLPGSGSGPTSKNQPFSAANPLAVGHFRPAPIAQVMLR
jgi:hypothetical protein